MRFVRQPSPAAVIASIALFVSLGGVSYGVATGSIDGREVKDSSLKGGDIRNGSLASRDMKKDSVGGVAIKESVLGKVPRAAKADSAGSATNAGALGGIAAGAYPSNVAIVSAQSGNVTPSGTVDSATVTATCPAGKKVIGGGGSSTFVNSQQGPPSVALQDSAPTAGGAGWRVLAIETGTTAETTAWKSAAFAICATR